jgi:ABC-type antimicrobial peptide transport system permease subunit
VPASDVKSMTAIFADAVATPASTAWLFVTFAALAVLLGVIGIYGVVSYLVSRRTREIGIRIALGAQKRDVLWMVMREGAVYSALGITLGMLVALATTRLLGSEMLQTVSPADPLTYAGAALVMGTATLVACYIPTRRALRVDPMVALRNE